DKGRSAALPYARVLVAVDLRGPCADLVVAARRAAPGASTELLHVLGLGEEIVLRELDASEVALQIYRQHRAQPVRQALDRLLELAGGGRSGCSIRVEFGQPGDMILRRARAFGADLLVLRAARGGWLRRLWGSGVARRVLRRTHCDVLLLPACT
ncbi:MAG: universal stress protein, partial [Comamonadaceae bacterium]